MDTTMAYPQDPSHLHYWVSLHLTLPLSWLHEMVSSLRCTTRRGSLRWCPRASKRLRGRPRCVTQHELHNWQDRCALETVLRAHSLCPPKSCGCRMLTQDKGNLGDMTLRSSDCARCTRLLPLSLNKCRLGGVFVRETCFLSDII
jgi:hypothetical protein